MRWISVFIIALSAFLLFSLEPMVGRALLPYFGSAQSVWLTCLMFFQLVLFAGYLYAHVLTFTLNRRVIHATLIGVGLLCLPHFDAATIASAASHRAPIIGVLLALGATIGVPFFLLTTCAPLVQRLYAERYQSSPYALYAASNIGSLTGLLSYPLLMEPLMGLSDQVVWWNRAFVVVAIGLGGMLVSRTTAVTPAREERTTLPARRGQWLVLAAIPSSLLMGTTTYLTTDVASIPLLWVLPLALYLFTFIIAFGRQEAELKSGILRASRFLALAMTATLIMGVNQPAVVLIPLSLALLFFASLVCHTRLVALQPSHAEVTSFYLYVAAGGALGGIFNAVVAPLLFTDILEYPLAILLGIFVTQARTGQRLKEELKPALPVVSAILLLIPLSYLLPADPRVSDSVTRIAVAVVVVMTYRLQDRGVAFPVSMATLGLVGSMILNPTHHDLVDKHRDFYGVLRVHDTPEGLRTLVHGRITHGREDPSLRGGCHPDGYYCRRSPLADVMAQAQTLPGPRAMALVGVGTGNSICYATPDEKWDLYELSPAVDALARKHFTYLEKNKAGQQRTIIGDGRLELLKGGARYALIVVDGFSSDSIPIHLLTREAVRGYLDHLVSEGLLAFHISNQYFQLAQPIADVAVSLGLNAYTKEVDLSGDCLPSRWVYLSRSPSPLPGWTPIQGKGEVAWSDDRSYLLSALQLP